MIAVLLGLGSLVGGDKVVVLLGDHLAPQVGAPVGLVLANLRDGNEGERKDQTSVASSWSLLVALIMSMAGMEWPAIASFDAAILSA